MPQDTHGSVVSTEGALSPLPNHEHGNGTILWIDPARVVSVPAIHGVEGATNRTSRSRSPRPSSSPSRRVQQPPPQWDGPNIHGYLTAEQDVVLLGGAFECESYWSSEHSTDSISYVKMRYDVHASDVTTLLAILANIFRAGRGLEMEECVLIMLYLRDCWHMADFSADNTPLEDRSFAKLLDWVKMQCQVLEDNATAYVLYFFSMTYLRHTYNIAQSLRPYTSAALTAAAADPSISPIDTRVWEMFLRGTGRDLFDLSTSLFTEVHQNMDLTYSTVQMERTNYPRSPFTRQTLVPTFMIKHLYRPAERRSSKPNPWDTSRPATTFEKVLFLTVLVSIEKTKVRTKRSRKSAFRFERASTAAAQHVGYAVLTIVDAWNELATCLGVEDAETLLQPYILFDEHVNMYTAITDARPSHHRKYAPLQELLTILHGKGAIRGSQYPAATSTWALQRSDLQDKQMRMAAQNFIQQILMIASEQDLFKESPEDVAFLNSYRKPESSPASDTERFTRIPALASVERSLTAFRPGTQQDFTPTNMDVVTEDVVQPSSSVTRRTADAMQQDGDEVSRPGQPASKKTRLDPSAPQTAEDNQGDNENVLTFDEDQEDDPVIAFAPPLASTMDNFARVFNCSFRGLEEAYKSASAAAADSNPLPPLEGNVQLVLTDPPYNTRRNAGLRNSQYDILTDRDIEDCVAMMSRILRPGGHGLIFTSSVLFPKWSEALREVVYPDHTQMFSVDNQPLFCIRHRTNYSSTPLRMTTSLMNMVEVVVHVTKLGAGTAGWGLVNYSPHGYVCSTFQPWTNIINNIPRLSHEERITVVDPRNAKRKMALRPEQKTSALLKEIIARFSQPGDVVVDMFAGTYSTGIAALTMNEGQYRTFVGCEQQQYCHDVSLPKLQLAFCEQLSDGNFASHSSSEVQGLATAHVQKYRAEVRKNTPPGAHLPQSTTIPEHLTSVLCGVWKSPSHYPALQSTPVDNWAQSVRANLLTVESSYLLAVDAMYQKVYVAPSSIPNAGNGLFSRDGFEVGDLVGYYYGSLVYSNLYNSKRSSHGRDATAFSTTRFRDYALQIKHADRSCLIPSARKLPIFLIPFEFCVCAMINDPKRISSVESMEADFREPNVDFECPDEDIIDVDMLQKYSTVRIIATRPISPNEELLLDYGPEYFNKTS